MMSGNLLATCHSRGGDEEHKEHEQPSSGAGRATHGTQTKG